MSKKSRFDGVIATRTSDAVGYIHAYDKNGRLCWDKDHAERVVLLEDLRKYGEGLHKGQLGWTVIGSTDGYKWVDVKFDSGPCIPVLTYSLERVVPEKAEAISRSIISECRGTRFDADPIAAEAGRAKWIREEFGTHIDSDDLIQLGEGPHEVYAYTFPSLIELAHIKDEPFYPVKIGCTADKDMGTFLRVRSQIFEDAAFPERVKLLLILRCSDGRPIEVKVHRRLRDEERKVKHAVGREWFLSNVEELRQIFAAFSCKSDQNG
ncbi:MAG: GIY-YIG nuclease family protein [Phycisphaeraceae bacterium]